jgi:hypothetical protein
MFQLYRACLFYWWKKADIRWKLDFSGFRLITLFQIMQTIWRVRVMVFNSTFNNISVIAWWSVLLVEDTGVPGENHQPVVSHWQTLSLYVLYISFFLGVFSSLFFVFFWFCFSQHWTTRYLNLMSTSAFIVARKDIDSFK